MMQHIHRLRAPVRWGLLARFTARYAVRVTIDAIHALDDALLPLDDDLDGAVDAGARRETALTPGQRVGAGMTAA